MSDMVDVWKNLVLQAVSLFRKPPGLAEPGQGFVHPGDYNKDTIPQVRPQQQGPHYHNSKYTVSWNRVCSVHGFAMVVVVQTHKRFKIMPFISTKQNANFRGNPLYQATKRHLQTVKNYEK